MRHEIDHQTNHDAPFLRRIFERIGNGLDFRKIRFEECMSGLMKYEADRIASPHAAAAALAAEPQLSWRGLPAMPGVYVLREAGKVLYVGESKSLSKRMAGHDKRKHLERVGVLSVIFCENHKEVERWLIRQTAPTLNGTAVATQLANASRNAMAQSRRAALGITVGQEYNSLVEDLFGSAF